jgi:hypothetical protein
MGWLGLGINTKRMIMKKIGVRLFKVIGFLLTLTACGDGIVGWQEEVKLNDGRVIIINQKLRCQSGYTGANYASCITREFWVDFNLPEFSPTTIQWHENLHPLALNVYAGKLYFIASPPTVIEFEQYGKPFPFYVCFQWINGKWERISFKDVPVEIYNTNLLLSNTPPPKDIKLMTLEVKKSAKFDGEIAIEKSFRRLDPTEKF